TGADLSGAGAAAPADPGATRDAMRPSQRVIRALWELEKPIVAGVNGVAAGLGAHLAYACDLVVAADEARFIEVFVRRGIALDAGGGFLPRATWVSTRRRSSSSSATSSRLPTPS